MQTSLNHLICATVTFVALISVIGCDSGPFANKPSLVNPPPLAVEQARVEDLSERAAVSLAAIATSAKAINTKADKIISLTPPSIKESVAINKEANEIKVEATKIKTTNTEATANNEKLKTLEASLLEASKQVQELQKQNVELRDQMSSWFSTLFRAIISVNAIILAIAIYVCFSYSTKIGLPIAISAVSIIFVSYFLITWLKLISIIGGVAILLGIIYLVVRAIKEKQALGEVVASFEFGKHQLWGPNLKEVINKVQSKSTKDIVAEIKSKLD